VLAVGEAVVSTVVSACVCSRRHLCVSASVSVTVFVFISVYGDSTYRLTLYVCLRAVLAADFLFEYGAKIESTSLEEDGFEIVDGNDAGNNAVEVDECAPPPQKQRRHAWGHVGRRGPVHR
jgi:hypothetical protein